MARDDAFCLLFSAFRSITPSNCETTFRFLIVGSPSGRNDQQQKLNQTLQAKAYCHSIYLAKVLVHGGGKRSQFGLGYKRHNPLVLVYKSQADSAQLIAVSGFCRFCSGGRARVKQL